MSGGSMLEEADSADTGSLGRVSGDHRWLARMITPLTDQGVGTRASFVSKDFDLGIANEPATLRISALGIYRAFVNGQRVGDDLLTPGWTCYDDRIAYQSYDVSSLLQSGQNRIEIWLCDGWYRSPVMWRDKTIPNCWGDRIGAIAEIEIAGEAVLATDSTWTSGLLPITQAGIYFGEDYDARLEGTFETAGTETLDFDTGKLVPQETGTVKAMEAIRPIADWRDADGRIVYDFGQNVGGFVRIHVEGETGATILIEHSEVLGPDKAFDNRNYRGARAALTYTLKGGEPETYEPSSTFMGYRYARVTITGSASVSSIESIPISSVPNAAGEFSCDVESVNRLVLNTIWSQRANFIEVPTDCPQRDERMGWTGDAQVFAGTACWLADSELFLRKYLRDVMHDQRPNGAVSHFSPDPTRLHPDRFDGDWAGSTGWGDAITIIPWQLYLHYGRDDVLRECFPAMLRWLDYLWSISDGPIIHPNAVWGGDGFTFGDWLQPVGDNRKPRPTIADDCAATLYHFISTDLSAKIAQVIGDNEQAERLSARAATIRAAFVNEYFSPAGRLAHNDQTSYALAFLYGLVPAEYHDAAKAHFRRIVEDANYLIGTGFIGTPALLPALTMLGMNDVAEKVFLNRDVPGWLYQVDQGATTIWERWDAIAPDGTIYDPMMNSYNHYAYGAVCQWLFEAVAGVAPTEGGPGFDIVRLAPAVLPQLGRMSMWHNCRHGRIEAGWRIDRDRVDYAVSLPEGCQAVISAERHPGLVINGTLIAPNQPDIHLTSGEHKISFDFSAH